MCDRQVGARGNGCARFSAYGAPGTAT